MWEQLAAAERLNPGPWNAFLLERGLHASRAVGTCRSRDFSWGHIPINATGAIWEDPRRSRFQCRSKLSQFPLSATRSLKHLDISVPFEP